MAAAEAYKLYREARAIRVEPVGDGPVVRVAAGPAAGEIIKSLVGLLTGVKAWLALVIIGVVLLWLAGNGVPDFCAPPQPAQPNTVRPQQGASPPAAPASAR
jgi:hypothetical protein